MRESCLSEDPEPEPEPEWPREPLPESKLLEPEPGRSDMLLSRPEPEEERPRDSERSANCAPSFSLTIPDEIAA